MAGTSSASSRRLFVPRVLWVGLLASQGIYATMLAVPGLIVVSPPSPEDLVLAGMAAAALGCAIASFVVPRLVHRSAIAAQSLELREVPDPGAPVGFRGSAPTVREYADVAAVHTAARTAGFAPFVLSLALSEAISVMGLVSALLGRPPVVWGAFIAVGATLTAIRFPTDATFFAPIERHTGVAVPR